MNVNRIFLGGRLTADPETRQTQSGKHLTTFTVAVNRRGKEAPADFIDCYAFEKTADFISQYFAKGKQIWLMGELNIENYKDKEGNNRKQARVKVNDVDFVDSRSAEASNAPANKPKPTVRVDDTPQQMPVDVFDSIVETDEEIPF